MKTPAPLPDNIAGPSPEHRDRAAARQASLTKPPGSLGRLEEVAIKLSALQRTDRPRADIVPIVVFAGDHGVTAKGVSPYPSEVTGQMMHNFVEGGAAISVLARGLGLPLEVVDVGTFADSIPAVVVDRQIQGTEDFTVAPAMSDEHLAHALDAGRRAVERAGVADLLILGDMGIGNTTAASALAAAVLCAAPVTVIGPGTGLDVAGLQRKLDVVERGLALHADKIAAAPSPAREALRRLGGLEIAALAGAMIAAARRHTPVVVDGFIVSVAALIAVRMVSSVQPWLLFGTRSPEPGHDRVLAALEETPLLDLGLRLGEGSGAALSLHLVRAACELHVEMATFGEAAISGPNT